MGGFNQDFCVVEEGGGKEVGVAALGEFEAVAEFADGLGEVADGEVGFLYALQKAFQGFFVEGGDGLDLEGATRKVGEEAVAGVKVAVGAEFADCIGGGDGLEAAGLHDAGVGLAV